MNIPLNINWQQILLHLFNFAILGGGLYFLLYKPVQDFMNKRTEHYQSMEDAARQSVQEAEEMKAKYAEELHKADEEIFKKKAEAQKAIENSTQQSLAEAQKQADAIVEEARKAAARSHEKVLKDTQKELRELAVSAAKKLIYQSDKDALDQFLEEADRGATDEQH